MALDILKECKKYIIQRINNPGSYLVVENENEVYNKRKIRQFERSLANDVVRCKDAKKITIGQMVAVKDEKGFHRGIVADIFNRSCKTMYWVLLIDSEKTVETHEKNIYLIKNQDFKDEISNALEITVHGIQPAALDINYENPISGGIFQKRKCNNWSEGAYKFVRNLFMTDPYIFVKLISCDKYTSGEIYFMQDSEVVSLGQKLCDEGFAMFCDTTEKSCITFSQTDVWVKEIEEKIPENALLDHFKLCESLRNLCIPNEKRKPDEAVPSQKSSFTADCINNESSSSSAEKTFSKNLNSSLNSCALSASKKSPIETRSSSDSNKTLNKEDENEPIKLNVCRIVMRNLKLFNQQKHIKGGHS